MDDDLRVLVRRAIAELAALGEVAMDSGEFTFDDRASIARTLAILRMKAKTDGF